MAKRQEIDRDWKDYPEGTKAFSVFGGHWVKVTSGRWVWCSGVDEYPTPGADAVFVQTPK